MHNEPSGDYYDYTRTMKPERPWLVPWHQHLVYRIMHALRGGTGTESADPALAAARPPEHRYVFGDGKINYLFLTFEDGLDVIKRMHNLTAGVPQIVFLTGWQFEGHDSKYPSWAAVNEHLKRPADASAVASLRWLIREARKYNCLATLHINMFDAYPDSPLFAEYVEKDIIAKDADGKPIVGNRWSGMDCYHVSYTQEWAHGLAQKRIDNLIALVPEIQENHCVYIDAFLGSRKDGQQEPISPYLGHSKETEGRTQRKIFRYWRDREIDVASEHVLAMRVDRFVGLQPYSASQGEMIKDLPDELYTTGPVYYEFRSRTEPEDFHERFCLKFLPWFYKNYPAGTGDPQTMIDGTDICMPALWCEDRTLIAYSRDGYGGKTWPLPADWRDVEKLAVARLSGDEPEPIGELDVADGKLTLDLAPNHAVRIDPC